MSNARFTAPEAIGIVKEARALARRRQIVKTAAIYINATRTGNVLVKRAAGEGLMALIGRRLAGGGSKALEYAGGKLGGGAGSLGGKLSEQGAKLKGLSQQAGKGTEGLTDMSKGMLGGTGQTAQKMQSRFAPEVAADALAKKQQMIGGAGATAGVGGLLGLGSALGGGQ